MALASKSVFKRLPLDAAAADDTRANFINGHGEQVLNSNRLSRCGRRLCTARGDMLFSSGGKGCLGAHPNRPIDVPRARLSCSPAEIGRGGEAPPSRSCATCSSPTPAPTAWGSVSPSSGIDGLWGFDLHVVDEASLLPTQRLECRPAGLVRQPQSVRARCTLRAALPSCGSLAMAVLVSPDLCKLSPAGMAPDCSGTRSSRSNMDCLLGSASASLSLYLLVTATRPHAR